MASSATSSALWSKVSGPSSSAIAQDLPPPRVGRDSSSSSRDTQISSTGTSVSQLTTSSIRSSRVASAQCRSSQIMTTGAVLPSTPSRYRTAHEISSTPAGSAEPAVLSSMMEDRQRSARRAVSSAGSSSVLASSGQPPGYEPSISVSGL